MKHPNPYERNDRIPNYAESALRDPMLLLIESGIMSPSADGKDTDRMIERQERASTEAAAKTSRLPIAGIHEYDVGGIYAYLGFKVGKRCSDAIDELFCEVELPEGWSVQTSGHSMWNDIIDEKGRKRANYFFKGAFYDRSAHMASPLNRFRVSSCGPKYKSPYNQRGTGFHDTVVFDVTKAVYDETGAMNEECILFRISEARDDSKHPKVHERSDELQQEANAWLDKNRPGWGDPSKYWE